jgi:hypothetical protein
MATVRISALFLAGIFLSASSARAETVPQDLQCRFSQYINSAGKGDGESVSVRSGKKELSLGFQNIDSAAGTALAVRNGTATQARVTSGSGLLSFVETSAAGTTLTSVHIVGEELSYPAVRSLHEGSAAAASLSYGSCKMGRPGSL